MTEAILPKALVEKWIKDLMTEEYSITIYPKDQEIPEKFIRSLSESFKVTKSGDKLVVTSNDPISLANLALRTQKYGHIVDF